jgi:hypothetical protein
MVQGSGRARQLHAQPADIEHDTFETDLDHPASNKRDHETRARCAATAAASRS